MIARRRSVATFLVLAGLISFPAACGSGASGSTGPSPTATAPRTATPAPTPSPTATRPPTPSAIDASVQDMDMVQVLAAVDSDGVDVLVAGIPDRVGYRGLFAPQDTGEDSPGAAAAAANAALLSEHWVFLEGDGEARDASGRLLGYVWLPDGRLVNEELIRLGVARPNPDGLDTDRQERFADAQATAVAAKAELIAVSDIRLKGTGQAQPDEYIEITNPGVSALDMSGWRLQAGHEDQFFDFPAGFTLEPGQTCRLYTNQVAEDSCGGYTFGYDKPILNNERDCGQLFDPLGLLIVEHCVKQNES